jgi:hypothetical protein
MTANYWKERRRKGGRRKGKEEEGICVLPDGPWHIGGPTMDTYFV